MELQEFAERFRLARIQKRQTVNKAAEKLGVCRATIQVWEAGRCPPSFVNAAAVAKYIGCFPSELPQPVRRPKRSKEVVGGTDD